MSFEEDLNKKWLCPLPFIHTTMRPGGVYGVCCESYKTEITIDEQTPIEFFNNEYSQNLREAFLTDHPQKEQIVQHVCQMCLSAEKNFGYSKRTRELKLDDYKFLEKNYKISRRLLKNLNFYIIFVHLNQLLYQLYIRKFL